MAKVPDNPEIRFRCTKNQWKKLKFMADKANLPLNVWAKSMLLALVADLQSRGKK